VNGSFGIEARCTRVALMVESPVRDQTVLLRAARMIKGVHEELTQRVWQHSRAEGCSAVGAEATQALNRAEQNLRRALIEYASLPSSELRDLVADALSESLHTVSLLHDPTPVSVAQAG
jgi:hypothetical protein